MTLNLMSWMKKTRITTTKKKKTLKMNLNYLNPYLFLNNLKL